ncbi:AEC family transporter [Ponticoccus alexandrii]|uniref:Malonate transporter n=1 Tax=Ponticoccus alexandrii TaxID=1943633 RepID=A0ABX7FC87_9RHOB|nr:AEC family transporter [Ponticoccus alexandrii]KID12477.1 malonate transporter [Rhodobacteraceae bacterium PD-2]QRF66987.1 malonate transporter [Ponticoccus alexandrii]
MLHVLTHDILPVFFMLALGLALGRSKVVSAAEAATLNRVAFLILQPALIFPLIARLDWSSFRVDALAVYAAMEVLVFTLTYQLLRRVFRREAMEAWLLSMATVFVNTLLYIWPISFLIYGEAAALPVTALVAWDSAVSFAFFIISTDLMSGRGAGPGAAVRRLARNPVLIAIALGLALNIAGLAIPAPFLTAFAFSGAAAAPLTLFALGVILSGHALLPGPVVSTVTAIKLSVFPALVWLALPLTAPPETWQTLFTLTAAGPSGAMAFALAMLYGVRTDAIAPVIVWTSVLSLISLSWLA